MKLVKKMMIFFILLICLLSISAIAGTDVNDDVVINENNNFTETLNDNNSLSLIDENSYNDENNFTETFNNNSSSSNKDWDIYNYDDFVNALNSYDNGDIFHIRASITIREYNSLVISKAVTIIGEGPNIYFEKYSNIFRTPMFLLGNPETTDFHMISFENINFKSNGILPAIYVQQANIDIRNCNFFNLGSAIIISTITQVPTLPLYIIYNCTFQGNTFREGNGGSCILCEKNELPVNIDITKCTFKNNYGFQGSGGVINTQTITKINDCIFDNNTVVNGNGGAIYSSVKLTIDNCIFKNNVVTNGAGGAICQYGGKLILNNSVFHLNRIDNYKCGGGTIFIHSRDQAIIYNSLFTDNEGPNVIFVETGTLDIFNSVFLNKIIAVYGTRYEYRDDVKVHFYNCWAGDTTDNTGTPSYNWGMNLGFKGYGTYTVSNTLKLTVQAPTTMLVGTNNTLNYYFIGSEDHKKYNLNLKDMEAILTTYDGKLNTTTIKYIDNGFNVNYMPNHDNLNTIDCYIRFKSNNIIYTTYTLSTKVNVIQNVKSIINFKDTVYENTYIYGTLPKIEVQLVSDTPITTTVDLIISNDYYYKKYKVDIINGRGLITTDMVGVIDNGYDVRVEWNGTSKYPKLVTEKTFNVIKDNVTITDNNNDTYYYGENLDFKINLEGSSEEKINGIVTFTVYSDTYSRTYLVEIENGEGIVNMGILKVDNYSYQINWDGNQNYSSNTKKGNFSINPNNATLTLDVSNTYYGGNVTFTINLRGILDERLSGRGEIKINGVSSVIDIVDGQLVYISETKFSLGTYPVSVVWNGNENYTQTKLNTTFTINKANSHFFVYVNNTEYQTNPVIKAELIGESGELINTIVNINVNNKDYTMNIINGKGSISTDILPVSNIPYLVKGYWNGTDKYYNNSYNTSFKVLNAIPYLSIQVDNIEYGQNAIVNVVLKGVNGIGLNGTVIIIINTRQESCKITNGVGTVNIDNLNCGSYFAFVKFEGDENYTSVMNVTSFDVTGSNTTLIITADDIYYGENGILKISLIGKNGEKLSGTVQININSIEKTSIYVNNGYGEYNLNNYPAAVYSISARWDGDSTHNGVGNITQFNVKKAPTNLIVNVNNVTLGENATININLIGKNGVKLNGIVYLSITNKTYEVSVINGAGTFITDVLPIDLYHIIAIYYGNENYNESGNHTVFLVNPIGTDLIVTIDNSTFGERTTINVNLVGEDGVKLNGTVKAIISDEIYYIDVVNGVGLIKTNILNAANYTVEAFYDGNDKYNSSKTNTKFTIEKATPQFKILINDNVYREKSVIIIIMVGVHNELLNGTVNAIVDDVGYTVNVVNGIGANVTSILNGGKHYASASWNGNKNYKQIVNSTTFNVNPCPSNLIISVDDVFYGEHPIVNVFLTGSDGVKLNGIVKVFLNDAEYYVNVVDGVGVREIREILGGGVYTPKVTWNGNDNYNATINMTAFVIKQNIPQLTITVDKILNSTFANVNLYLTGAYGEKINSVMYVTFNNHTLPVFIENSIGSFTIDLLKYGEYPITAIWHGNENYTEISSIFALINQETLYKLIINVNDVVYGDKAVIQINLTGENGEKLDGVVEVTINNEKYLVNVTSGYGYCLTNVLGANIYNANAFWKGNAYYGSISNETTFVVNKAVSNLIVNVNDIVYGGIANIIVKTNAVGNVVIIIDNVQYEVPIIDGFAYKAIANLNVGVHDVIVRYGGNQNFTSVANSTSFNVNKISNYTINITGILNIGYIGGNIIILMPTDATGFISLVINNQKYFGTLINGVAIIGVTNLNAGNQSVFINYTGNQIYNNITKQVIVNVPKVENYNITTIGNLNIGYNGGNIIITLPNDATGGISIVINNQKYIGTIINGVSTIPVANLNVGNASVFINYTGDKKYNNITKKIIVNVPMVENYNKTVVTDLKGEDGIIIINLPKDATGSVVINNYQYVTKVVNGTAVIQIPEQKPGSYIFNVTYTGDKKYENFSTIYNLTFKENYILKVENITKFYGNDLKLTISLTNQHGMGLANQIINILINGVLYKKVTDNKGLITLNINLPVGSYVVKANWNNTLNGTGLVTILTTIKMDNVVKIYKNGTQFYANFIDSNGKPLVNTNIVFIIDGTSYYTRTTNSEGVAKLNINLSPGSYTIVAQNTINNEVSYSNIVVISSVYSESITKMYMNGTQFYARFLNSDGKVLVNASVTFNINGVYYTKITNSEGIAKLNINLLPGTYIITCINSVDGCMQSSTITILSPIEVSDLVMVYSEKKTWNVKVLDEKGSPVKGAEVHININGVFYSVITDYNGVARLNINLNPGEYIATAYYNNYATSRKITVLSNSGVPIGMGL